VLCFVRAWPVTLCAVTYGINTATGKSPFVVKIIIIIIIIIIMLERNSGATETICPVLRAKEHASETHKWSKPAVMLRRMPTVGSNLQRPSEPTTAQVQSNQLMSLSALTESKLIKPASDEMDGTNRRRCLLQVLIPPPRQFLGPWQYASEGSCIIHQ
jgi:hypothetical protein